VPDLDEICEALKISSQMLAQASTDHWTEDVSEVDTPVRNILLRVSELLRASSDLGLTQNPTALGILSRQILESFISLQWIISDPKRASKYSEFALNEFDRIAQMVMRDGLFSVKSRQNDSDVTEEFQSKREKPKKGASIEQQAREAGLIHVYQIFYRFMSLDTHGKSEILVGSDDRLKTTLVHLQTIGAISQASGHIAILWLMHRQKADNEKIRELLGLNDYAT